MECSVSIEQSPQSVRREASEGHKTHKTNGQTYILCPFWHCRKQREIHCEGLVQKSEIVLMYSTITDTNVQVNVFCKDHYANCEIYRAVLEARYPEY